MHVHNETKAQMRRGVEEDERAYMTEILFQLHALEREREVQRREEENVRQREREREREREVLQG